MQLQFILLNHLPSMYLFPYDLIFSVPDPDFEIQNEPISDMEIDNNPWDVKSIYELQYFNCPGDGCNYKNHSKQEFADHIVDNHPEYLILKKSITDDSLSDIINPILHGTPKNKGGQPKKPLLESSPESQRNRLKPHFENLKKISENENCPFNILLGKFGSRFFHDKDAKFHKLFTLISNGGNPLEGLIIDEATSLKIKRGNKISDEKWDNIRKDLQEAGMRLTSRWALKNYEKGKI